MRLRHLAVTVGLALSVLVLPGAGTETGAATWAPAPIPSGSLSWLAPCSGTAELDCIEAVGAVINGADVNGILTGRTAPLSTGGVCCHEWRIPGLVNEDGTDLVETQLKLTGDNVTGSSSNPCTAKCLVGLQGDIYATSRDGFRPQWESKLDTCGPVNGRVNGVCSRFGNLQQGVTFFMVLRASWTLPSIVSSKAADPSATSEKLGTSGASRVRVQGVPHRVLGVDPPQLSNFWTSPTARGAWSSRSFAFHLLDGRQFGSYTACAETAPLVMGDNTRGAAPPTFDKSTGALDLKVVNPHFDTDGTTVSSGVYQARVPKETAQCLWGPKITSTKQFSVSVLEDSTGAAKVSTTSITSDATTFRIDASGFTFSSPTVRVTAIESAGDTGTAPKSGTAIAPSKPTGTRVTASRGKVTVSFTRATSVSYSATAVFGRTTRKLSCRSTTRKVTCTVSGLKKGTWKLSVVPRNSAGTGSAYTMSVRVP